MRVTAADSRQYYEDNGYVVMRGLLGRDVCAQMRSAFEQEVKPFSGYIYRQASANPEKHRFTDAGTMLNSILNPVSVNPRFFPLFRQKATQILASDALFEATECLLGEQAGLAQSMYFEGNPATWAHQDCYYLDSADQGRLVGAWIALEDIDAKAGRFYVYPESHKIDTLRNAQEMEIAYHHDRYKQHVLDLIESKGLKKKVPALQAGDVLFWNSRTIHGAEEAKDHRYSRNSLTAHLIPAAVPFLQYQRIAHTLDYDRVNGHLVFRPKDQRQFKHRARLWLEKTFPKPIQALKKRAIARILQA